MEREGVFLNVPAWADVTCHTSPHKLIQHTSAEPPMHATPCTLLITFSAHWSPALHPARCSQDGGWWAVDATPASGDGRQYGAHLFGGD